MTPVLSIRRVEPWLGREMAGEEQVSRFASLAGRFAEDPHPSEILKTRSGASDRLGDLYRKMLDSDSDLAGMLLKRSDAVLSLPRRIEPADSSDRAVEVAEFCQRSLARIPALAQSLRHQVECSRAEGVAFEEIVWERLARGPDSGAWVPVDLIDRPMWRFLFRQGVLHVRQVTGEPIQAPPAKFLRMRHGTKDSPWGTALLDKVYWYWFIKKHGFKWYAVFIEKWAQPTVIGKYPRAKGDKAATLDQDNQNRLLQLTQAIQSEQSAAIPEDLAIELLEASRSGSVSYEAFLGVCTRGEALVLLGETNTSDLNKAPGSYASKEVSNEIRWEKVVLDAHDLGANLRDGLLRPMVELNFGADVKPPRFVVDTVEGEDLDQRREGIEATLAAGEAVPRHYFFATNRVPVPREGEPVIRRMPARPEPQVTDTEPAAPRAGSRRTAALADTDPLEQDLLEAEALAAERDARLFEVAEIFRPRTLAHFARHRDLVLEAWTSGAAALGETADYVVDRLDVVGHAEVQLAAVAHALGLGLAHLIEDGLGEASWVRRPQAGLTDLPLQRDRQLAHLAAKLPAGVAQADRWATAVDYWARLLGISKDLFSEYTDVARRFAFTVAGIEEAALLADVQDLVRRALADGIDLASFRQRLDALYEEHGVTPTSSWHADLIYNNNIRQANGALIYQQTVGNPEGQRLLPYLRVITLGDDRVRARPQHNHRIVHGLIFASSHRFFLTWWYPFGHGCRCLIQAINRLAAQRLGLIGAEPTGPWPIDPLTGRPAQPDPGFRAAPDLRTVTTEQLQPRLDAQLQRARTVAQAPGGSGLLGALGRLLQLLLGFNPFGGS